MGKGESRLAGVTVDRDVPGDPRYHHLAELLDLENHYEAIGRMVVLWSVCTALRTDRPPARKIISVLGVRGPDMLVEADLGERLADGSVRVKGCVGRHEWYGDLPARGKVGGTARASDAQRNKGGRFLPKDAGRSLEPAGASEPPASTSERENAGPASPATPAQDQDLDPEIGARVLELRSSSGAARSEPSLERVQRFLDLVNAARQRVAAAHKLAPMRPLELDDEPTLVPKLLACLQSSATPDADLEHVVGVAEAEARADIDKVKWLGWAIVEGKAWRTKLMAPPPRKQARASPVQLTVISPEEHAEVAQMLNEYCKGRP